MPWSRRLEGLFLRASGDKVHGRMSAGPPEYGSQGSGIGRCFVAITGAATTRMSSTTPTRGHSLASASSRIVWLNGALLDHFVDDAEIPRRLRSEEIGALERVLDFLQRLAGVTDVDLIEALFEV